MVLTQEEYICTVCDERFLSRSDAENCLCSPFHDVRTVEVYLCPKCAMRFPDADSAKDHGIQCRFLEGE